MKFPTHGFTLLELLIVFAIIALLALPGWSRMPNAETMVRSKVSRVRSDMRSMSTRLEEAKVASGAYPDSIKFPASQLTGSMQQALAAEFGMMQGSESFTDPFTKRLPLVYYTTGKKFVLLSTGPDEAYSLSPWKMLRGELSAQQIANHTYDPTNGIKSFGDVYRLNDEKKQ